jgi:hypothetical protein
LLYRLLFVFYAEDRNLLPSHDKGYSEYSLRSLRHELHDGLDRGERYSARADRFYKRLQGVFRLIDGGDTGIGLPPYNGGLFDDGKQPLLSRAALPDSELAPILDSLSRRQEGETRKWINYRDLSVQHLGAIYEHLFEFILVAKDERIAISLTPFARKGSGSYYTHEDLVHLILERAVGPLIDERVSTFRDRAEALAEDRGPKARRLQELFAIDPASGFLEFKICDPAMGSGHFLVSLVDYLADQILEAMAEATELVTWTDKDHPYVSPLATRIGSIRDRILAAASREGWHIERSQLDDRHIVRRMILKRVVYGVDKNLMAVELAKVALWLHTFTVGAPLSFLDHHLRCGDSLFGERVAAAMTGKRGSLLINRYVQQAKQATMAMTQVEEATDADITEVRTSGEAFAGISADTRNLTSYLDFVHALRWLDLDDEDNRLIQRLLDGQFGDAVKLISGEAVPIVDDDAASQTHLFETPPGHAELGPAPTLATATWARLKQILDDARTLAQEERFLHWEVAFPGVWSDWESLAPVGGFDAIIGNPPWDRMKLQEVEWFATRRPEIAKSVRASDRKTMIAALERTKDPLWDDYVLAQHRAEQATRVARKSNYYPLLSGGDLNIYSLFVERGQALVGPDGIVGLLVPSGISGDKSASEFFASVATTGRLACLLDFENRGAFFPDVHRSFKFCVFVTSGPKRKFAKADCAFYLHGVDEISARAFALEPDDFTRVNPNTGTAPVFRTPRDASITRGIYERLPVLVLHSAGGERAAWPIRYSTMYHMTNDSSRFEKRETLERTGFYLVDGNRLKKAADEYVPLYEGKMVQAYDHRAANVVVNLNNLNRPAQPEAPTTQQKMSSEWLPASLYWIKADELEWPRNANGKPSLEWAIGFKDVTAPTNFRTMIAAAVPFAGFGNTLPLLLPSLPDPPPEGSSQKVLAAWQQARDEAVDAYRKGAPLLLANLNSVVFDFVARQKVQGQHLNWYIVEQLPVVPADRFEDKIAGVRLSDFIRDQVLHLTYTAVDMKPFARDMGYGNTPFAWDDEDRRHRRARVDALFFQLYGIGADDASYILDTFPIAREHDQAEFGRYRTKELVLAYMRALQANDLTSRVSA